MGNKLKFEKHVPEICKKINNELIAISRLLTFLGLREQEILIINVFAYCNFNYDPLQLYDTCQIYIE